MFMNQTNLMVIQPPSSFDNVKTLDEGAPQFPDLEQIIFHHPSKAGTVEKNGTRYESLSSWPGLSSIPK